MYGMDISAYQKGINLNSDKYEFCIIKATEGTKMVSTTFFTFAEQLLNLDKLIGCYHFARPDIMPTKLRMCDEADFFIEQVKKANLLGRAILVLDWETEPMDRDDLITDFVIRVESQTGVTPWIYGSKSKLNKWKDYWAVKHCPIWMAAWPFIRPTNIGEPLTTLPDHSVPWQMWQYSSNGKYPDFSGNVDLDYTGLTKDEWLKSASSKTPEKEDINEAMQWAIGLGLFSGYGDGKYHPKDPLTREQLAIVLKKYTKLMNENMI